MITTVYLIARIDGHVRLTKGRIRLGPGEVAIPVNIKFPTNWGRSLPALDVTLPDPPVEAEAGEPETQEDRDYPLSYDAMRSKPEDQPLTDDRGGRIGIFPPVEP